MTINIGDSVMVIMPGKACVYGLYGDMARNFGIKNWASTRYPDNNKEHIVKGIKNHLRFKERVVVWIEDPDTGYGYMVSYESIRCNFITSDEFKI